MTIHYTKDISNRMIPEYHCFKWLLRMNNVTYGLPGHMGYRATFPNLPY